MIDELKNAKRKGVVSQLASTRTRAFQNGKLTAPTNLMAADAIKFLEGSFLTLPPGFVSARTIADMIGEYVAVSSFTHCFDALSYLGNACNAVLGGSLSTATHLAYYAELRAAMAFLACEGIGVFHDSHCLVEHSGNGFILQGDKSWKTHRFTWKSYEWLSSTPQAMSLLYCIRIDGMPLTKWIKNFPSGAAVNMACSDYLKSIGLDIKNLSRDDQGARGKASYRPTGIEGVTNSSPQDDVDLVRIINEHMCGPNGPRDSDLGVLILCAILRNVFESTTGLDPHSSFISFKTEVEQMISTMGPSSFTEQLLRRYCLTNPLPHIPLVGDAISRTNGDPNGILARATLLCFHSLAYTRNLLSDGGVSESELKFWWMSSLENRGAIGTGSTVTSQSIVQELLDVVQDLYDVAGFTDRKSLWDQFSDVLTNSCRCERFAVAGFFA